MFPSHDRIRLQEGKLDPIIDRASEAFEKVLQKATEPVAEAVAAAPVIADAGTGMLKEASSALGEAGTKQIQAAEKMIVAADALVSASIPGTASETPSGGPMQIQGTLKIEGLQAGVLHAVTRENSGIPQPRNA